MKKLILILVVLLVSTFSFANVNPIKKGISIEKVVTKMDVNFTKSTDTKHKVDFMKLMRRRTCYYSNGELLGCTAWEYYWELDDVNIP